MQRRKLLKAALAATSLTLHQIALAQTARTTRIVVPFAAGGPIDVTARILAERVRDQLGGPVIIENRPGAGGNIGMEAVARATPDGLTLGVATTASHGINPWLFSRLPYDPVRDFVPVTQMLRVPNVLVMNTEKADRLGIHTLADLVRYAKAHPGQLNYGSGGNGSAGHLAAELFKQHAGIYALHIPYNGGNPAQLALLTGQVDFNIDNLATAAPNIRSGKLRPLAVTTASRSELLPGVPALAETFPGLEIDTWWGLIAPAGTPQEAVARINQILVQALKSPELGSRFATLMAEPSPSSPEDFGKFLQRERVKYQRLVRLSGAKPD